MKNVRLLILSSLFVLGFATLTRAQITEIIQPYAGGGGSLGDGGTATAGQLSNNYMIASDAAGNLFIADQNNNRIRRIDAVTRIITTIAGDGTAGYGSGDGIAATAARVNVPVGIAVDGAGNIYIGDRGNHRIRKIDGGTGIITTICGTGTAGGSPDGTMASVAQVSNPRGVAVDGAGNVYFTDGAVGGGGGSTHRVRKINISTGLLNTVAGIGSTGFTGDGAAATLAQLNNPRGLWVDASGNIFIADMSNHRVRRVDGTTGIITTVVGSSSFGGFAGDGGPATAARLNAETDVKLDAAGNMYIGDVANNRVRKVDASTGIITTIAGSGTGGGAPVGDWGPATAGAVAMASPVSVAVLPNTDYYFISSQGHNRIRYVRPNSVPYFTGPGQQSFSVCEDGAAFNISSMLSVYDSDKVQIETWSVGSWAPLHGSLNLAGTGTANGGVVATAGKTYTPTPGYSGTDSFIVQISDGYNTSEDTFFVTINPLPVVPPISGFGTVCVAATLTLTNDTTGGVWTNSNANATVGSSTGIVTGVSVGTTDISYTVTNACGPRTVVKTVTINPLPNAGTITGTLFVCAGAITALSDLAGGGTWSAANANATVDGVGNVTGVSVGTDMISYTVVNSCGSASATALVTVDATPVVPPISGPNNVCVSATVTLTDATGGGSWTASNANATVAGGVVTGVTAGTVDISYTVVNSCGTTAVFQTETVNPLPNAGAISGGSNVCIADVITLTTTGTPGGTWSTSNSNATVSSGGVVTGVTVGAVTISYSVTNGCGTNVATFNVNVVSTPSAGVISGPNNVCPGLSIALTDGVSGGIWTVTNANATITGGGVVTGVTAGIDTINYTVTVTCGTATAAYVVTVNPLPDPGTITGPSSVCVGSSMFLTDLAPGGTWTSSSTGTATVSSGGMVVGIASGTAIISYSVTNVCGTLSALRTISVDPNVTPSVTFTASPGFTTCPGTLVTYTALPVNGGISPTYEWRVNGFVLGAGPSFNHTPLTGDIVTCIMTTSLACVTTTTASSSVTVVVNPTLVPAVNISTGIVGDTVCIGTLTSYSAVPVNGGSTPAYTWYVNGTPVGAGNPFTYIPNNGDVVTTAMTSSYACPSPATVMSNSVTMTVNITEDPAVTITVSPVAAVCIGSSVMFTAHPLYGGIPPFFRWTKNGVNVATGLNYIYTPANGDNVFCLMASSSSCRTADTVLSNHIILSVQNPVTVAVTITQSSPTIGVGGIDVFTATVTSAALTPTYQWYENGVAVPGATTNTYIVVGSSLGTKAIHCVAGSGDACYTTGTSNTLTVTVANVGVNDITQVNADLKLIPNPNKGIFTMNLVSGIDETAKVVVTNILGEKVKELTANTNKDVEINLDQAPGIYFLSVVTEHGRYVAKVMVE